MSYDPHDTIVAVASAPSSGARGIVRISGRQAGELLRPLLTLPEPLSPIQLATVATIRLAGAPATIPCHVLYWPDTRSYTREPVVEIHTVGSPPLLRAVVESICRAGARLAEPGEFTLRAFLAGRLDLTQAEAVLGIIDATSSDDLGVAIEQLAGNLARPLHQLREELLLILAELEAGLDFAEEEIEFISRPNLLSRLRVIALELTAIAEQMAARLGAPALPRAVLVGTPNSGKSSLFNALIEHFGQVEHTRALVSASRGTTRDYLTATILVDGRSIELIDTAGLAEDLQNASSIDAAAQHTTDCVQSTALVRILCVDCTASVRLSATNAHIVTHTKADLLPSPPVNYESGALLTSSHTGAGLDELATAIQAVFAQQAQEARVQCVAATAERCEESMRLAQNSLDRAVELVQHAGGEELVSAELRVALAQIGKVVGAATTDDILDRIFRQFCIGK